jgi:Family of unknown function (DUF5994)
MSRLGREADVMSTPNRPTNSPDRVPLRLRLAEHPGRDQLDGGWWPQSRDLVVEFADLVDHFPPRFGRVIRGLYSPPDWEPAPRRVPVSGRYVKVGSFPRDDTHLITLTTSYGNVLQVLVVPPGLSADQGAEALLASATPGNASTAVALLDTVTELPDVDRADQWSDGGGSWWDPHPTAPSVRTGG